MQDYSKEVKTTLAKGPVAAGSTDVTDAAILDCQGFEGFAVEAAFGTLTSTTVAGIKIQQSDASDMSGATDLEGSKLLIPDTDSNKILISNVFKPLKRYARVIILRATANAVVNLVTYKQYGAKKPPVTQSSDVSGTEQLISPVAGTA